MSEKVNLVEENQIWKLVGLSAKHKICRALVLQIQRKADESINKYKVRLVAKMI